MKGKTYFKPVLLIGGLVDDDDDPIGDGGLTNMGGSGTNGSRALQLFGFDPVPEVDSAADAYVEPVEPASVDLGAVFEGDQ